MNKKQKQELRQRQTVRQLMGISQLTGHGVRTAEGELAFFLIRPDNLSVLSEEGVRGRVTALTHLLCAMPELRILALDSRESFQRNQEWYRQRLEQEELPALRELLRQDSAHLDEIQTTTASAREFVLVSGWISRAERATRSSSARWKNESGTRASMYGWRRSRTSSVCCRSTTSRM